MVVLDVGQLGGEDADAAGGHGGGEGLEAGLVDAEMVDAVEDDEGGGLGGVPGVELGEVEAGADGAGLGGEGEVFGGDGMGDGVADDGGDGLAGDLVEDGDGFEVVPGEGPGGDAEDDQGGDEDGIKSQAVGTDGGAGLLDVSAEAGLNAAERGAAKGGLAGGAGRPGRWLATNGHRGAPSLVLLL